ncbi:MAG: c-type cytochrome [Rhodospirillales bacterium]|nr:c-type cytochrome [Rhodospirillales bacterium]MDE2319525.1 c-type cytochrome [Rhodospirillales bacterium]
MKMLKIAVCSFTISLFALAAQAASPPALYTAAQAGAGAAAFMQNCAVCHGATLGGGGGPALVGQAFTPAGTTIGSIFNVLAQQMPATNPGGLTHGQYEDLMAYILQKNGYPAGATPITYDKALNDPTPLVSQSK